MIQYARRVSIISYARYYILSPGILWSYERISRLVCGAGLGVVGLPRVWYIPGYLKLFIGQLWMRTAVPLIIASQS
jgi:hypothetical protein